MRQNYKMIVCYDGTRYSGWQKQKETENTIQGKLETVLGRMADTTVEVTGSGRTDAGVHAYGQTANFFLEKDGTHAGRTPEGLREYLNTYLPEDIAVRSVEETGQRFHSRYSAVGKIYRYTIGKEKSADVFRRRYVFPYYAFAASQGGISGAKLCIDDMRKAAADLTGSHDFKSFCGNKHMKKSTVRTIRSITVKETKETISIDFEGDGFLPYMVRIMAGTLIEIGNGSRERGSIPGILESHDRQAAGITAPASGLMLMEVLY